MIPPSLGNLARLFLRLGLTAFGGLGVTPGLPPALYSVP